MKYLLRLNGDLGSEWADWFGPSTVTRAEPGITLLSIDVADQAALHGLIARLRDLAVTLVSITPDER